VPKKKAKERILQAAKSEFSEKGYLRSNIAEIARKSQVTNSMLYQYFKGKEDILFSIPAETMNEILEQVETNLKGIWDATSLLSKLIWVQLIYSEKNPESARIILECRSQKNFYKSKSYNLIRNYGGILSGILEKGIKDGVFREDLDVRLVRDMVFGAVDFELLSFMCIREIDAPTQDLEQIMNLILPMIVKKSGMVHKPVDKATKILLAAEQIFAEKGLVKAKLSDVAKLAGVADGTVYEYFKNKEDILMSISARRIRHNIEQFEDAFSIKTPLKRLRRLVRYHFSIYLTNRNFLKLFILDTQLNPQFYDSEAYKTFQRYFKTIEKIIEDGKAQGIFRSDVNSRVFRNLFIGTFSHISIRWFILGDDVKVDMMKEIDQVTDMLSLSVLTDEALEQSGIMSG